MVLQKFVLGTLFVGLLIEKSFTQECYTQQNCMGDPISGSSSSVTDCCDNGQSYGSPEDCRIPDCEEMIIGFSQRRQTVSESDVPFGNDLSLLAIDVISLRKAEISYAVGIRTEGNMESLSSDNIATVEPVVQFTLDFDALFGNREFENSASSDLVEVKMLAVNASSLESLGVLIRNDLIPEETECFLLSIYKPETTETDANFVCNMFDVGGYFCEHEICIVDDDEPFRVAFVQTTYTVLESDGSVEVCVNLTYPSIDILDETVHVKVFHDPNSVYLPPNAAIATPDPPSPHGGHSIAPRTDYEEETMLHSTIESSIITAVQRIVCYNQIIYDDLRLELTEYAGLVLEEDNTDKRVDVEQMYRNSVFTIVDDDIALVGLQKTFYSVTEDVSVVEVCVTVTNPFIECPVEFPFNVNLSTADGSAVSPSDYRALSLMITFDTCERQHCTFVNIAIDLVEESVEYFHITLERTTDLDPRISLDPVQGEVVIDGMCTEVCADELISVGYELSVYTTSEGEGMVDISIVISDPPSGGAPRPFNMSVSTEDGRAESPDNYASVSNQIIQFHIGDVKIIHTIFIHQDEVCNDSPNKDFFSRLFYAGGVHPINIVEPRTQIIIDDTLEAECDPIHVGYEQSVYTIDEDQLQVRLCAVLYNAPSGGEATNLSFLVSTMNGTAESAADYGAESNTTLSFTLGQKRACYYVNIINDDLCEIDPLEEFFAILQSENETIPILVDPSIARIIIDDSDAPECDGASDSVTLIIVIGVIGLILILVSLFVATAVMILYMRQKKRKHTLQHTAHINDIPEYSRNIATHHHTDYELTGNEGKTTPQKASSPTEMNANIAYRSLISRQQLSSNNQDCSGQEYSEVIHL